MKIAPLIASLALLASGASAGGLAVFRGAPGGPGEVLVVPPGGGAWYVPLGLEQIRLLTLEVNGRTELERFLPGRAWLEQDVPGAARAVLPQRQGSVYRYRRDVSGEGSLFGFFIVDEGGDAWRLYEIPGTGPAFDVDPFVPRIAIAPDGQAMLVATTAAAGGDLLEVSLGLGGGATTRTETLPPLVIREQSLALHASWGVAVASTGIVRFQRPGPGQGAFATYSGTPPTWWSGDLVLSRNGAFAAAVGSSVAGLGDVWVFGPTSAARCASDAPMPLSGAGFLPEAPHGPYLAVSDDGGAVAWRVEGVTREAYLAKVLAPSGQSPEQVSSDAWFLDTLDELGQYSFKPGGRVLVLGVGALSANPPVGLESTDYFSVWLDDAGVPQFTNLTQTNGVAQAPFYAVPELDPVGVAWTPALDAIVFHDDQGGDDGRLCFLRPDSTGVQVLLEDVKELFRVDRAGADLVAVLRRSTGNKDIEVHLVDLQTMTTTSILSAPDADEFPARAVTTDGVYAFVQRTLTYDWMWGYDTRQGKLEKMTQRRLRYGPAIAVGPDDELGFTVGPVGALNVFGWWPFSEEPERLPIPTAVGFYLPGI